MITIHDVGLDYVSNFQVILQIIIPIIFLFVAIQVFFSLGEMEMVLSKFHCLHLTMPGQESHAEDLPPVMMYPNLEQLASLTSSVLQHYRVSSCVGLGVGLGANILLRLAIQHRALIDGLILINSTIERQGRIISIKQNSITSRPKMNKYQVN